MLGKVTCMQSLSPEGLNRDDFFNIIIRKKVVQKNLKMMIKPKGIRKIQAKNVSLSLINILENILSTFVCECLNENFI